MNHGQMPRAIPTACALVAAGAFVVALLGIEMTRAADGIASLWLANAVLTTALLIQPRPAWPLLAITFVAANAAANVVAGDLLSIGLSFGVINAFESLVAASLILHRCGRAPNLESLPEILHFAGVAGLLAPALSATVGAGFVALSFGAPYAQVWPTWFAGDALGNLTLAPLLLLLIRDRRRLFLQSTLHLRSVARTAWPVGVTGLTALLLFSGSAAPFAFLTIPAALLATYRLGLTGAALSAAIVFLIGGASTALGTVPMSLGPGGMAAHVLNFQLLVATVLGCTLPMAALLAERQALATGLEAVAYVDGLTGLPNRRALYERLDRLAQGAAGNEVGLLILDLDRFKAVNDLHGHLAGDALLRQVAARMIQSLEAEHTAYRLGGDEFAVVCELDQGEPERLRRLANHLVQALAEPFEDGSLTHHIGASAGIAKFPADAADRQTLLRRADIALYRAKADGRGRHCCFQETMDDEITWRAKIEEKLRAAIRDDELRPVYQPIVDLASGRPLGFEMLARWPRTDGPSIGPDVFIPIAEERGLINDLTFQLLARACRDAADWDPSLTLAINLAPVQLRNPQLVETMLRILESEAFPPGRLVVEMTETALIADTDAARRVIEAFGRHGISVVLDDFGTGYSSLHYLRTLPFDKIKIDRSFIGDIAANVEAKKIVRAIAGLGASLDLPVVAEGVEDQAVIAELLALGCTEGQGFHYGAPMSAELARAVGRSVLPRRPSGPASKDSIDPGRLGQPLIKALQEAN